MRIVLRLLLSTEEVDEEDLNEPDFPYIGHHVVFGAARGVYLVPFLYFAGACVACVRMCVYVRARLMCCALCGAQHSAPAAVAVMCKRACSDARRLQ